MIFNEITERCKQSAKDMLPDMPKENTLTAWEDWCDDLENMRDELSDLAWQEVEHWDWAIYTHYGMQILDCLPMDVADQAESEFFDLYGDSPIDTLTSVWDMASRIAYLALVACMSEALDEAIQDCLDLAETQIENL